MFVSLLLTLIPKVTFAVTLVQHTSRDAGTTTSATLDFTSNNTSGNWIGVCIRAGATNELFTVTDSRGNTYRKAIQFSETQDGNSFGIFYAENIAGGANTVTVSDSTLNTLRFAILEYAGVAASGSLDAVASTQGNSASPNSGNAVTTANGDLLLGAIMTANPATFTAAMGYQIEEGVPTEPATKLIAEDQIQANAGGAFAGASLGSADFWAAGVAAFKVGTAPILKSANNTTFSVGAAGTFTVTAAGTPTPSLSETGALPGGVTFSDNGNGTASLSGTPASGTAGTYSLTITASNGIGTPASQAFSLTVASGSSSTPLGFVQVNYATPQTSQTLVTVTYTKPQTADNLNVVVVGWNDSIAQISSVTDSKGNAYALAVGPTVQSGTASQAIYYAANIVAAAANSNSVTVAFNTEAAFPDIRIAEYAGIDPTDPVDVVAAEQGNGTPSNSGSVTTRNANDLLVGANLVQQTTSGPGPGYTSRVITSPDADILEDAIVTMAGSHSATAPVGGQWIMQMVAFRAAASGGGAPPPVGITISPTSASLQTGGTQQFTATVTGTSNTSVNWNTSAGTVSASGFYTAPNMAGTYTVTATSVGDVTKSASAQVTVTAPPQPVAITISPTSASLQTGGTQQFTAAVTGTSNTSVNWSASAGTISASGVYTAPNVAGTYAVTATSSADATKSASAQVTVTAPQPLAVTISPTSASLRTGGMQQFTATITGNTNTSVNWSATGGTVSASGLYTAGSTAGTFSVTATSVADPTKSASATVTVSATTGATGPLRPLANNPRWFTDGSGKAIFLSGSHTWDTFQDTDQSPSPAAFDFSGYVDFLKSHGDNVTILWRKDLPTYCGWGAGGTWHMTPFPWQRTGGDSGTQFASDGLKAFNLSLFDQSYFDRLRARAIELQQNGIYAIVELFDGLGITNNRCSNDGYPFSAGNNVNGVSDDNATSSMTMTSTNSITYYQDLYVQKVIDTLNDLPNVLWEVSEEAPANSIWWQNHMISLIHTYEAGKSLQHPLGFPTLAFGSDSTLYNSNADWVAPAARISPTSSCGSGVPACKVNVNDSDHSYFGMWNDSAQTNRNYLWENFENGNSVIFMDPYFIYWSSGTRNICQNPVNGVCNAVDTRWDNLRNNMGAMVSYANRMNLAAMTPQPILSSTNYCLANAGVEYLVYEPGASSSFTVSVTPATYAFEWFSPNSLTVVSTGTIAVSAPGNQSFTKPFNGDAVLYLKVQ